MGLRYNFIKTKSESPFSCNACDEKLKGKRNCGNKKELNEDSLIVSKYTNAIKKDLKIKDISKKVYSLYGNWRLYECPNSLITTTTNIMIDTVASCKNTGKLLVVGGVGDQPKWLIDAMNIYNLELQKWAQYEKTFK